MDKIEKMMSKMIDYALEKPESSPHRVLIIGLSKGGIEKLLTRSRMELIFTINSKKPKTIHELVKLVNRPKESVSRDLRILANYGLLKFKHSGREKMPEIEKDMIAMPLTV